MPDRTFSVFDGSTFVVGNGRGDLAPARGRVHGFFRDDTRFVSSWRLTLDGEELESLSVADLEYFAVDFFLTPVSPSVYANPYTSVIRRRVVRGTWTEELAIINYSPRPVELDVRLEVDADFADLFEVKDEEIREREIERIVKEDELIFRYRRGDFVRETHICVSGDWEVAEDGFRARVALAPQEERWTSFQIRPRSRQSMPLPVRTPAESFDETRAKMQDNLASWIADAPSMETDWGPLRGAYEQGLADLAALRCYPEIVPGAALPAAGLPWFMALFGRDSLITSYQALPMRPSLARTTLLALAACQSHDIDDFRDRQPGKILHELRFGELTFFGERPHSPYYGSADATPLFLILLDEFERWTGDAELVRRLEPNARAALRWIDEYGDLDGDGYVEYLTRNPVSGLVNQCWKDSWNSMLFADGTMARPPIASCEIQGYVYDAKRRCARLARAVWNDPGLAERLDDEADSLRRRFHQDFWVEDGSYYALALDRDKRRVDSLTSNIGHLLWSGIVDDAPARMLAEHLLGERLFSGWGVRTMAVGDAGHNPMEYHNGTVWPHDNSLIAEGLRRYGFRAQASQIVVAMLEASTRFSSRLPEAFAGYPRQLTQFPVEYPSASLPQAWATASPMLFVRTLLGLDPAGDTLVTDAWLPEPIGYLALRSVTGRWGSSDVGASRDPDISRAGIDGTRRAVG